MPKQNIFITEDFKSSIRWSHVGVCQFSPDSRDDPEEDGPPIPAFRADHIVLFNLDALQAYKAFVEFHKHEISAG